MSVDFERGLDAGVWKVVDEEEGVELLRPIE